MKQILILVGRQLCDIGWGQHSITASLISKECCKDSYIAQKRVIMKMKQFVHRCANFGITTLYYCDVDIVNNVLNKWSKFEYSDYQTHGSTLKFSNCDNYNPDFSNPLAKLEVTNLFQNPFTLHVNKLIYRVISGFYKKKDTTRHIYLHVQRIS